MTATRRAIVFGGGRLGRWALDDIRPDDLLVGADRGAAFLVRHGLHPAAAIGDFDSVDAATRERIRRQSGVFLDCDPVDKDRTDLEMALDWVLELAVGGTSEGTTENAVDPRIGEIELRGATGTRLDHTLANIFLLRRPVLRGVDAALRDATNRVRLAVPGRPVTVTRGPYRYVSLLPLAGEARGVTLAGFKYPLENAVLVAGSTLSVSNELAAETGTVIVAEGELLVVESRDGPVRKGVRP
ncbi:MAG: thiamine diphosphokinase [Candidatus Reconcilbacillus cellulovorans]|uniref:Thiamine diphosphokinase n=1 Tax=Candidatus Reconcilbacillus cellulovorans TaxID=1906605 RepID=A0A2A6E177_9BACL|nr:MAG: thiamine diphosphokinase [Candidatus Reconcilbacillus cellulovorans]